MISIFDFVSFIGKGSIGTDKESGDLEVSDLGGFDMLLLISMTMIIYGSQLLAALTFFGGFIVEMSILLGMPGSFIVSFLFFRPVLYKVQEKELKYLHRTTRPPHKEIDNFMRWESGDEIHLPSFKPLKFQGALDNGTIILEYEQDDEPNLKDKFPPKYLRRQGAVNEDLKTRLKKERNERIDQSLEESRYQEVMDQASKELEKLEA